MNCPFDLYPLRRWCHHRTTNDVFLNRLIFSFLREDTMIPNVYSNTISMRMFCGIVCIRIVCSPNGFACVHVNLIDRQMLKQTRTVDTRDIRSKKTTNLPQRKNATKKKGKTKQKWIENNRKRCPINNYLFRSGHIRTVFRRCEIVNALAIARDAKIIYHTHHSYASAYELVNALLMLALIHTLCHMSYIF